MTSLTYISAPNNSLSGQLPSVRWVWMEAWLPCA